MMEGFTRNRIPLSPPPNRGPSLGWRLADPGRLLFPELAMYEVWLRLLPDFEWLNWGSFFLGLAESYGYGWYFALIWVPLYNVFSTPRTSEHSEGSR